MGEKGLKSWSKDFILKKVVRNSSYIFASQAISAILSILTANLLGVSGFGVLGVVISFISNVNRLLSFRMSEFIVRYVGAAIAREERKSAVAVIKLAAMTEATTSLIALTILMLLAPWAAEQFAKDPSTAVLFRIYGLTILGNLVTETSTGILQVTGHFRSQAVVNFIQGVITALLFLVVFLNQGGVMAVMLVYLAGKMILGLGPVGLAFYWLHKEWGTGWWKGSSKGYLPPLKEMARFAVSTNLSGTINLVARDSEVLWVSYFFSTVEAGYFKVALAIVNLAIMPITPFISTTYPELAKNVALQAWTRLKSLLKRVTAISGAWTSAVILGLLLLGKQLLFSPLTLFGRTFQVYQSGYLPAFEVLLILMIGFGMANIFFWDRSLLLSFNKPGFVLKVAAIGVALKTLLAFLLVPRFGYIMEAMLLTAYFVGTVGTILLRGVKDIRQQEKTHPELVTAGVGE